MYFCIFSLCFLACLFIFLDVYLFTCSLIYLLSYLIANFFSQFMDLLYLTLSLHKLCANTIFSWPAFSNKTLFWHIMPSASAVIEQLLPAYWYYKPIVYWQFFKILERMFRVSITGLLCSSKLVKLFTKNVTSFTLSLTYSLIN